MFEPISYSEEFPFRPSVDHITKYICNGKTRFFSPIFPSPQEESLILETPDQYNYLVYDVTIGSKDSRNPSESEKAIWKDVKNGKTYTQLEVAARLKSVYKARHGKINGIYSTLAKHANIPAERGSGFITSEEQVDNIVNHNRYMTLAQAKALCDYLGCTIDFIRTGVEPRYMPFAEGTRAASTLNHVEKALKAYEFLTRDSYQDRMIKAVSDLCDAVGIVTGDVITLEGDGLDINSDTYDFDLAAARVEIRRKYYRIVELIWDLHKAIEV